ncbi:MAG: hypothetical protein FIB08_07545 [Candidatus Methanoperedens sp.]|nr:hypothetical protein [Candidatus Methanoperedens sp.]
MKKSYIKCPYCPDEVSISGSSMHVRNKHPDKYEEFKKNFAEIKKTAVVKESATKIQVPGSEPPKIEDKDKQTPPPPQEPSKEVPKEAPRAGDEKPKQGGSFLDEFNKWLDSPDF